MRETGTVIAMIDETPDMLIRAIAERQDRAAFVRLFQLLGPRIKSYMMRQGTDAALADDLIQDVMLSVWKRAKMFDSEKASAVTWIFAIARNRRIDLARRERRLDFDLTEVEETSDPSADGHTQLEDAQSGALVRKAMEALSDDQALVVRLSFFEDKSHSTIAEELGLPLGTVKSRIRLAMDKLRSKLGEQP